MYRKRLFSLVSAIAASAAGFAAENTTPATAAETATLTIHADQPGPTISRNIYGQFSEHLGHCIYEGIWVGPDSPIPNTKGYRNDVLAALKALKVPQLRWPGGCFADEYHWRDGIGPREKRPSMYNSHWGGVVENNHFGTHEFLDLCEMLDIAPYICVNVGSGTPQEAMEWIEYMTSDADSPMANLRRANGRDKPWKVPFIAVGNEAWGCGGNMRPEYYADNFRRFNTFIKNYVPGPDHRLFRVACGPSDKNYDWTETLMTIAGDKMDGLSLHYYTLPTGSWSGSKGKATGFDEAMWFSTFKNTLRMEEFITKHSAIMDRLDPARKVALVVDEWGTWYDVEPGTNPGFLFQQNTLRDAIVAAINLHIFQAHADRVRMANIAQVINVLQAMILTDKDRMLLTPTYHVFEMFQPHQDATELPADLKTPDYVFNGDKIPALSASASRDAKNIIHLSLANADPNHPITIVATLSGATAKSVTGRILTAPQMDAHNTFDAPHTLEPASFTGARLAGATLTISLPAKSVVMLAIE